MFKRVDAVFAVLLVCVLGLSVLMNAGFEKRNARVLKNFQPFPAVVVDPYQDPSNGCRGDPCYWLWVDVQLPDSVLRTHLGNHEGYVGERLVVWLGSDRSRAYLDPLEVRVTFAAVLFPLSIGLMLMGFLWWMLRSEPNNDHDRLLAIAIQTQAGERPSGNWTVLSRVETDGSLRFNLWLIVLLMVLGWVGDRFQHGGGLSWRAWQLSDDQLVTVLALVGALIAVETTLWWRRQSRRVVLTLTPTHIQGVTAEGLPIDQPYASLQGVDVVTGLVRLTEQRGTGTVRHEIPVGQGERSTEDLILALKAYLPAELQTYYHYGHFRRTPDERINGR